MRCIAIFLVICPFIGFSQRKVNPDYLKQVTIKLDTDIESTPQLHFPFSEIKIIDNRFDTSKIGFGPLIKDKSVKYTFESSCAGALQSYYNKYYAQSFAKNNFTLLIVIKKFWMSNIGDEKNKALDVLKNTRSDKFFYFKWEYYIQKENMLIPFKRVDTVISITNIRGDDDMMNDENISSLKQELTKMIEAYDFSKAVNNFDNLTKKTFDQFITYNKNYFDIPILKDSAINKGVFVTFQEFKNNKPSIPHFQINKNSFLQTEDGDFIKDYWGYYDGNTLWGMQFGQQILFRKNNTFEFSYPYKVISNNATLDGGSFRTTSVAAYIPYQIDMETGKAY